MENLKTKSIILLAGLVTGIFLGWIVNGWWSGNRIAKLEKDHAETVLKAEQNARKKEQAMQAEHDALAKKYEKEKKDAQAEINNLRNRIRTGAMRLSVPTRGGTVPENTGAWTGKTRAELDPKTADDLVAIAADGDEAIRELNLCIDQYQAIERIQKQ
ncbi:lysis system i-spanin subunit Rz [Oxalobacter aliiformigenes]|uniref:lysis system i-spanin subunit Rz n=1 Tax=Oxalobacter aliiformigenes TaxID=2946593 RepID=UPI0022AF6EA8|nr:lysis system i-spanin subunit Rz [Oxalobacter aliiformigenes]MCZ4065743.1 lysis system i-spanin subunit Rz [Oxalobacter aliiformigenes]WAV98625.1 lysis system i-spanin subunit Rz [Oxalobacter aliiformigenes]